MTGIISYIISSIFNCGILFFLIFFASVIFNIEILSLFKAINGITISILTGIELVITFLIWQYKKFPKLKIEYKKFFKLLKLAYLKDKSLIFLSLFLLFLITISFILAGFSPVNEPDAQSYHALRALFWVQDGFIHHFEATDIRCHVMPINSEIFYAWVYALFKNDTTLGLLQFFAYFLTIFSSYKIMEFYKIDFRKKLWAIFIFSSFAGVISQMSSTQTDLTTGSLLTCSMYLILKYTKDKKINSIFFSALALSISFGVKSTGIIGSIPILIFYMFLLRKDFIKFFLFLSFNFLIFSSYNYILNFIDFNNFLGSKTALLGHGFWGGFKGLIANFIRYIFQLFDFSGFTLGFFVNPYLLKAQNGIIAFLTGDAHIGENVPLNFTNVGMTEQYIGFGILGFIVFLPSLIIGFLNKKLRIFSILFITQILVLSFSIAYMIYSIRFIVTFMCTAIPLLSLSYFKKMNIAKFFIIALCFFYMAYASMFLSQRPFILIKREFAKVHKISAVQEKMRDLNYKFYNSIDEGYVLKKELQPYCKNGNNIALAISAGTILYGAKFLEFSNDCKISIINIPHFEKYTLSNYDIIVTVASGPQATNVIDKNDIKKPLVPTNMAKCYFRKLEQNSDLAIANYDEMENVYDAVCKINDEYIKNIGFKKERYFTTSVPEILKKKENEKEVSMNIWKKSKN